MPPTPFSISNGIMYIKDWKGNYVELTRVENIDVIDTAPVEQQLYNSMVYGLPVTYTLKLKTPLRKGQRDILCGRPWTYAASRYRRWQKRQKEKERRRRLKNESVCRDSR